MPSLKPIIFCSRCKKGEVVNKSIQHLFCTIEITQCKQCRYIYKITIKCNNCNHTMLIDSNKIRQILSKETFWIQCEKCNQFLLNKNEFLKVIQHETQE